MSIHVGVAILLSIILLRWAVGYWRQSRLKHWWRKGQAALEVHDFVAAEVALRECVRLAPIYAPVRRVLGRVLAHRHKLQEAEEHLRMGAELEPRNPAGHLDLGLFLAMTNPERIEEAIDALAKAVECDPDLRGALSNEARLMHLRQHKRFRELLASQE